MTSHLPLEQTVHLSLLFIKLKYLLLIILKESTSFIKAFIVLIPIWQEICNFSDWPEHSQCFSLTFLIQFNSIWVFLLVNKHQYTTLQMVCSEESNQSIKVKFTLFLLKSILQMSFQIQSWTKIFVNGKTTV